MNSEFTDSEESPRAKIMMSKNITMRSKPFSPIKKSREVLWYKYFETFNFYFSKPINELIADIELPHVLLYKDFLYYDDEREFLRRPYTTTECQERHSMLCSLYNNLDFMMRPNLAVHSQNNIILKRNLKLQKLYFTKMADRNQMQIPVIPRYIEDIVYSSNAESETPQTDQGTASLENGGLKLRSVLNSLKHLEYNGSYQTAGLNAHDSRRSSQTQDKEAFGEDDLQLQSLKRLELKASKDAEPVSLGTSFNNSEIDPQFIQGVSSTPNSRRHISEDSDYVFFFNLSQDPKDSTFVAGAKSLAEGQNDCKVIKQNEVPKPAEIIKHTAQPVKKRANKQYDLSADPKVALQNFSKMNEGIKNPTASQSNLLAGKTKTEISKQTMNRNLMESPHADMKREIRLEYREPSLADKILSEGVGSKAKNAHPFAEQNLRERGVNLRVSASPKLHKIRLSKSPLRDHSVNSPLDPLSPVSEKRSFLLPRPQLSSKFREERSPLGLKRNPITTKIYLTTSPLPSGDENSLNSSNNSKGVVPNIKNFVMKLNNKQISNTTKQGSEEYMKSIKDSNYPLNKFAENPLLTGSNKDSSVYNNNFPQPQKQRETRLSSANSMNSVPDALPDGSGSLPQSTTKLSPRLTLQITSPRKNLPVQLSPDSRAPLGRLDTKTSRDSSNDKVNDKKSPKSITD